MLRRSAFRAATFRRVAAGQCAAPSMMMPPASYMTSSIQPCTGITATASAIAVAQRRALSWSSLNPFKGSRKTDIDVEDELPEVFAEQPAELDEYIRPEKTMFEHLEDYWEWASGFLDPVQKQFDLLRYLQHDMGFGSWGAVLVVYGFMLRLISLIPALYANRNALRMQKINAPMSEINQKLQMVKNDKTMSSADRRVATDGYKRMKKSLYKKYDCAQWRSALPVAFTPVMLTAFFAIQRLTIYEEALENTPFLWVSDLSMPDPTMALPIICAGSYLANFELNQAMQSGGRSNQTIYIRYAMRVGLIVFIYMVQNQPSAMFAYWIGMSLAGAVQPILLRYQPFREYFNFPDPPEAAKAKIGKMPTATFSEKVWNMVTQKKESTEERREKREKFQKDQEELRQSQFERASDVDIVFEDEAPAGKSTTKK